MNELRISATKNSPEVIMMPDGNIKIRGRSIHESAVDFYKPVGNWINEYVEVPAEVTCLDISLEYLNSSSAKILINLCQRLSKVHLKHKKFIVNWFYEEGDEDILERGEYFSSILNIPFNFIRLS